VLNGNPEDRQRGYQVRKHIDKLGFGIGYGGAILSALNMLFFNKNAALYWAIMGITIIGIILVCLSWIEKRHPDRQDIP
jgi:hypothetical protein